MPTLNPRINVTLSVSLDTLVTQLAGYTRVSKSQVLRELLEEVEPALRQVVALMEATGKASEAAKAQLSQRLGKTLEEAEDVAAMHLGRLGRMTRDLVSQAEAIRGKRPARGGGGALAPRRPALVEVRENPPASNRGVKSAKQAKRTARTSKRPGGPATPKGGS